MKRVDFKNITIKNFLSIGNVPLIINFKPGLNIITGTNLDKNGSKNGVGKSTIADALYFCLFGSTIRELVKDEIVNNVNQKNCEVRLEFNVVNGSEINEYVCFRSINPTKFRLFKNEEDITKSSMPETTEEVVKLVGNPEIFANSVIMTINGTVPFMSQKKVERRKFCEGLFNLSVFSNMLLVARQRYNSITQKLDTENAKKEEINKSLEFYIQEQNKRKIYKDEKLTSITKKIALTEESINTLNSKISSIDLTKIEEYKNKISILSAEISNKNKELEEIIGMSTGITKDISIKTEKINNIKTLGDECERCYRPITKVDSEANSQRIMQISDEVKTLNTTLQDLTNKRSRIKNEISMLEQGILKVNNNINNITNQNNENKLISSKIDQLNQQIETMRSDLEAIKKETEDLNLPVDETKARLKVVNDHLDTLSKQEYVLGCIKYIVSEEGVKSYIIKKLLKLLNGKLAQYLIKLDAPCKFKFDEYFNECIVNDKGQECSYNNFSSGEQRRIDLAILFTFMDIRRLQGNTALNISFFDEILDTSLDDMGIQSFIDILKERIEKYNECAYIITHKDIAIKEMTGEVIHLLKKDGFTSMEENNGSKV